MKIAPLLVAGTLAMLLLVAGTAKRVVLADRSIPLDVVGIEVLEVDGDEHGAEIAINSKARASVNLGGDHDSNVAVVRRGNILAVRYKSSNFSSVHIVVPASIRRFELNSRATITALDRVADLQVRTSGNLTWKGDAEKLRVTGIGGWRGACAQSLVVEAGSIGRLDIVSPSASVGLGEADRIGVAEIDAGRGGRLSLAGATHLENIHLKPGEPVKAAGRFSCGPSAPRPAVP